MKYFVLGGRDYTADDKIANYFGTQVTSFSMLNNCGFLQRLLLLWLRPHQP